MSDEERGGRIEDSKAPGLLPETMAWRCGWCGRDAWFRRRQAVRAGTVSFGTYDDRPILAAIYQCSGCERPSLVLYQAFIVSGRWETAQLEFLPASRAIPLGIEVTEVEADRLEAWSCHLAGQHKAAILMARSALQRATRVLDTKFRGSLKEELDNLRTTGVITEQLRRNADEVRITGNDVAHPEEMGSIEPKDAEDSLRFLDDFLETTIAVPERQRRRQALRGE